MKIEDIAQLANVSKSAVSLAINGKPGVSDETREKILAIAKENNYKPLRSTPNRINNKSTIRFIISKSPDLITEQYYNLPFFNELIGHLSSSISDYPYDLVISTFDERTLLEELEAAEKVQKSKGIVLLGTNIDKSNINLIRKNFKNLVIIDTHYPDVDANFVAINNFLGGYLAAEYLIDNGHNKIGYVMGIPRIANFKERKKGFFSKIKNEGLSISENHIFKLPAMKIQEGSELNEFLLNNDDLPTAIFCENDYMAISLIRHLKNSNIKVPEQISVVGFDDIPESRVTTPELTTIQVDKKEMAIQTLVLLEKQIQKHTTHKHIQVNTSLIERGSSQQIERTTKWK
ncbi:LacI family DNA-binding transcriptional regulator [Marinilactibacillus psychrotolerans]|uniref:LacI family DNA-binding transcriptional regulator n=1 Tax=Marinilactibacillus psychrotolerans TaxID=191770 RepID=UPI0039AEFEE6